MLRKALLVALALAAAYVGGFVWLWIFPSRLVFDPRPLSPGEGQQISASFAGARDLTFTASDGTAVHAWYLPATSPLPRQSLLLYFGGASEQVHWLLARRSALAGWDLLLVDYRGYGLSGGRPGEAGIEGDAAQWLRIARSGNATVERAERVVVMATGIGAAVATHLAATQAVDGVALIVPVDSGVAIAQAALPIYPVRWLVRDRFDAIADAPRVRAPTIFFVAANDAIVPAERSRRLVDRWGSASRALVELPHANHSSATSDPLLWQRLGEFLRSL